MVKKTVRKKALLILQIMELITEVLTTCQLFRLFLISSNKGSFKPFSERLSSY